LPGLIHRVIAAGGAVDSQAKRVLVYEEAWGQGGIETFLMNLFQKLQGKGLSFTLFSTWDWNDKLDSELASLGIDRWTCFPGYKPRQLTRLKDGPAAYGELIKSVGCDVSYVNTMNGMGFLWSEEAKRQGVPIRIVHSHNSAFGSGEAVAKAFAHGVGKVVLGGSATMRLAVSEDAGHYLFGARPFEVINNGIDIKRFAFNPSHRARIREQFNIPPDSPLFGSVGRIAEAKNPLFQLRVFAAILQKEPNAFFLMVGDGDLRDKTVRTAMELGIADRVLMPGYTADPAPVYSALDCFLMPSLYEGLAMVRVESQCSGCPVVCSDSLPIEGNVTDAELLLPLDLGEDLWAENALELAVTPRDRSSYAQKVASAGFDIEFTATRMVQILGGTV
jgi:glycosyltransferase involved in cell wall biosynthesis